MLATLRLMVFCLSNSSGEIKTNIEIGRAENEQMWRMVNTSKITCGTNSVTQSGVSSYLAGLNSTRCFVNNKSMQVVSVSA